jgi:hypothetical protein
MASIFDRIKQKAFDAFNGVKTGLSNAYGADLNKGLAGTQSLKGFVDYAKPQLDPFKPLSEGKIKSGIKPLDDAGQFAGSYIRNWVTQPLEQIPSNLSTIKDNISNPDMSGWEKTKASAIPTLQTAGALFPGDEMIWALANATKAKLAGNDVSKNFTGQEYTGVGDALTGGQDNFLSTAGNALELPALLAVGGVKSVKKGQIPTKEFTGDYAKGDIKQLTKQLDELLGIDKSFSGSNGVGPKTAIAQLEAAAAQGDDIAAQYLKEVNRLQDDIVAAMRAKDGIAPAPKTVTENMPGVISEAPVTRPMTAIEELQNNPLASILDPAKKQEPWFSTTNGVDFKPVNNSIDNILGPAPIAQGFKPKGATNVPDFLVNPEGVATKTKELSKKATQEIPTPVTDMLKNDETLALPSGNIPVPPNPLLKPVGANVPGVPKGVLQKTWDALVPGSKKVIEKQGPAGKKISEILDIADEQGDYATGSQNAQLLDSMKSLTDAEKKTLADVIEGNAKPVSEAQAAAAETWKAIADSIQEQATAVGLDIGKIDNYFPHHVLKDTTGATGDVKGMLSRASERRYGNLELTRQSDMPYDKDPSVLFDYIDKANKRIADAKNFGADDRVLYNLVNEIGKQGGDATQARTYLDQILGKNQNASMEKGSQAIRTVESFKLGITSPLTNLTQNISTLMRTDPKTMATTVSRIITNPDEAIRNAIKANEITPDMARVLSNDLGKSSLVGKWLKLIGFTGAEKFNRIVAVNAGIDYSNKLIKQAKTGSKAAIRELDRLGFNTKELDKINPLEGGKAISKATQFTTDVGELPYGWQTPIGRVLTQFKSFAYKQTGFIGNEVKRMYQEGKQGNFKPVINFMTTYGVAAPIMGEVINDLKAIITNKERETEGVARYFENIMGATSLGLLDSFSGLTGKYGTGGVISAAAGPAAGDVVKVGDTVAGYASDQESDNNRATRNIVRSIPGVGGTLANTFVPNSYVDNQNIGDFNLGVNEGLNKPDKATYKEMQKSDPTSAEAFKERTQATRTAEDKKSGFFSKVFSGKETEITAPAKGATPAEKKAYDTQIRKVLDEGGTPSTEALKVSVFKGKSAASKSIEERMAAYKALETAVTNPDYTEEQKAAIMTASGAKPADAEYFTLASKDQEVRLQELMPKLDNMDEKATVDFLMKGRKAVGGKQLVNNAMVDYLYENDYISEDAQKAIKALKYDELKDSFYFSKSFAKSGKAKELTYKQAKALFTVELPKYSDLKSVDSLLKSYKSTSQTGSEQDSLISSILSKKAKTRGDAKLWFNK